MGVVTVRVENREVLVGGAVDDPQLLRLTRGGKQLATLGLGGMRIARTTYHEHRGTEVPDEANRLQFTGRDSEARLQLHEQQWREHCARSAEPHGQAVLDCTGHAWIDGLHYHGIEAAGLLSEQDGRATER